MLLKPAFFIVATMLFFLRFLFLSFCSVERRGGGGGETCVKLRLDITFVQSVFGREDPTSLRVCRVIEEVTICAIRNGGYYQINFVLVKSQLSVTFHDYHSHFYDYHSSTICNFTLKK